MRLQMPDVTKRLNSLLAVAVLQPLAASMTWLSAKLSRVAAEIPLLTSQLLPTPVLLAERH